MLALFETSKKLEDAELLGQKAAIQKKIMKLMI